MNEPPGERTVQAGARRCGACSLCCSVLRVDELAKLGGRPCLHQQPGGGCAVHAARPSVCRAYRCAWLGGAFGEEDRPDRLGAVLDLVARGQSIHLVVRQADPRARDRSERLRAIIAETRRSMPVEIRDVDDVLDPDRRWWLLKAGLTEEGEELEIAGDEIRVIRDGRVVERRHAAWPVRVLRRIAQRVQRRRISRWPAHEERMRRLGLPAVRDGKLREQSPELRESPDVDPRRTP